MNSKDEPNLKKITLMILDVDGVLTNGQIILGNHGDELKSYDARDGLGIELLTQSGIQVVVITKKKCRTNKMRCKDLGIVHLYQGVRDKLSVYSSVLKKLKRHPENVCCIGDDLTDLPMLRRSGFAVAVQNASPELKIHAHYVTTQEGGRGAVREVTDRILKAQGKWDEVTRPFFS